MFDFLAGLPIYAAYAILAAVSLLIFYLSYKLSSLIAIVKFSKERKRIEHQQETVQKSLKNILDGEKKNLDKKVVTLNKEITDLQEKVETYRKKISGIGGISVLAAGKKRSEIIYALLIENELLQEVLQRTANDIEAKQNNKARLKTSLDIEKRQELIEGIMQKGEVKQLLQDILNKNLNIRSYKADIEKKLRKAMPGSKNS